MKPAIKQFTHAFFKIPQNERKKNGRKGARIAGYEPYSPEEDAYLIEHYQKIPFTQIGKNLGAQLIQYMFVPKSSFEMDLS